MIPMDPKNAARFKKMGQDIAEQTLSKISMAITSQVDVDKNVADFHAANAAIDHVIEALIQELYVQQAIFRDTRGYKRSLEVVTKLEDLHG